MTSVDSGVETSNDSNDSCGAHDSRSSEMCPIKISTSITRVNSLEDNLAFLSSLSSFVDPSCSSMSEKVACQKEKNISLISSEQKTPVLEIDPSPGLSFCALSGACEWREKYEVIGKGTNCTKLYSCTDKTRARLYRSPGYLRRRRTLEYGPQILFRRIAEQRKLRNAASTNNEEQVAALLDAGINPNCYDEQLRTPLHLAACRGYSNVVRLLLQKQADPNFKDSLGNTPLHLAACTNHVEVVTLLLKAGTDVTSNDFYGRNPLQLAQSRLKLLQRGSNNEDSLKIKEEVQKVIEMMLTFLHKKGQDSEAELLNAFQTRLTLSQTKEEVETDVRDLLASLGNLNLNKSDTT